MNRLLNETSASDSEADAAPAVAPAGRIRRPLKAVAADMQSPREVLAVQALPALAAQLAGFPSASPSTSPSARPALPRLPPITLLTAAASALPPVGPQAFASAAFHAHPQPHPQLLLQPRPATTLGPHAGAAADAADAGEPVPDALLCRYRNKKCGLPRAIKRNGDRHNLCEKHRAKANQNQRKLESKRRQQKRLLARAAQQSQGLADADADSDDPARLEPKLEAKLYRGAWPSPTRTRAEFSPY